MSGYNAFDRFQIIQSGYKSYINLRNKEKEGVPPFYQSKYFQQLKRKHDKHDKINNWYKCSSSSAKPKPKHMLSGFSSVFFVPSLVFMAHCVIFTVYSVMYADCFV